MKRQHGKQRLFEVVARLDKTFKPTLNESSESGYEEDRHSKAPEDSMASQRRERNWSHIETDPHEIDYGPDEPEKVDEYGGFGAPEWEDQNNPDREHDRFIYKKYVQNKEPKVITLKYPAVCKETGKRMNPGEQALYYPQDKSFFCLGSKQAQEWREMKADDQMGGVYENELSEIVSEFNELEADEDNQPKTEEERFEELVETYINGNITFFAHSLKGMEVGELIRFLRWAQANNVKF